MQAAMSVFLAFGLFATSAGISGRVRESTDAGACKAFLSTFSADGHDNMTSTMMGEEGGYWSPCTHLKTYGLNIAPFLPRFLSYQLAPKTVLEFGCGLGTTSDSIARQANADVTCIEPEKTLGTLISSLRRDNMGNGKLSQLALNIFSEDAQSQECSRTMAARKHDLVLSLEVAEHIPQKFHRPLVDFLADTTGKWLVFSAARPDQTGTGHIPESMLTREQWQNIFEEKGFMYMQNLTEMARWSTYPIRGYDLFYNMMVFKRRDTIEPGDDIAEAHPMLRDFMYGGLDWERSNQQQPTFEERAQAAYAFAEGHSAAMWPSLTLLEQQTKKGMRCAGPVRSDLLGRGRTAARSFDHEGMTSAWASYFHASAGQA